MIIIGAAMLSIAAIGLGHRLDVLLDSAGLVITLGGMALLLVISFGAGGFTATAATLMSHAPAESEVASARAFLRQAATYALACGFLGSVLGMMFMLVSLADPSQIGPGLATALLAEAYGVFAALVCYGLATRLERRAGQASELDRLTRRALTETCAGVGAGTATVLLAFLLLVIVMGA